MSSPRSGSSPVLPPFSDPYEKLLCKSVQFETQIKAKQAAIKEHLRSMTYQRDVSVVKHGVVTREQVDTFQRYLSSVAAIAEQAYKAPLAELAGIRTEWSSALSNNRAPRFLRLTGLGPEHGLSTLLYAAMLRQFAQQKVNELLAEGAQDPSSPVAGAAADDGSSDAASATAAAAAQSQSRAMAAVTLLRQASGVYAAMAQRGMLNAVGADPMEEKPPELIPGMAMALQHMCLGEAQAVLAYRAQQKGNGGLTLAALHAGACDVFGQAQLALSGAESDVENMSDRLKKYIGMSVSLHKAKAYRCLAEDLRSKQEAPSAESACMAAAQHLKTAEQQARMVTDWKAMVAAEAKDVERLRSACERDRVTVYVEPLPSHAPELTPAKVLVSPLEFRLEPTQLSIADSDGGSGCSIM